MKKVVHGLSASELDRPIRIWHRATRELARDNGRLSDLDIQAIA